MIDLHCHIIYDVDDGSKSLDESIQMIKSAIDAGFTSICFTPHYMEDGYKTDKKELRAKFNKIKEEVLKNKVDVKLFLGEEVMLFPSITEKFDDILFINDGDYLLFELPIVEDIYYLEDVLYRIQSMGKFPILAHPERYLKSQRDFEFLRSIRANDVLFQLNVNSIIGQYGKDAQKLALKLLSNNMVDYVSTDSHTHRDYVRTKKSLKKLKALVGEKKFEQITSVIPSKIINNIPPEEWKEDFNELVPKKRFALSLLNRHSFLCNLL